MPPANCFYQMSLSWRTEAKTKLTVILADVHSFHHVCNAFIPGPAFQTHHCSNGQRQAAGEITERERVSGGRGRW